MTPFFILGFQRCGTTYLARELDKFSDIELIKPFIPEPKIFWEHKIEDTNDYLKAINRKPDQTRIVGEKTTSYLESPEILEEIKSVSPDSKFILLLRNPIERALSHFFYTHSYNIDPRSLEEVFIEKKAAPHWDPTKISMNPFNYFERSKYLGQIQTLETQLGAENLVFGFTEKITQDENSLLDIYHQIGGKGKRQEKYSRMAENTSNRKEVSNDILAKLSDELKSDFEGLKQIFGEKLPW